MKLKKSQLKEAIKSITRDCLNERYEGGQRAKIEQIVEFVVRKAPAAKRNVQTLAEVAGQLFKKQFGVAAKPNLLMEAAYKVVAPRSATDAKEDKARRIQREPKVNETQTLPPNKGQYKTVAPHAYTTTDQNKALTIQSDPEINENDEHPDDARERHEFERGIARNNRRNPQRYECPTCKTPNALSHDQKQKGYQCNACADAEEGPMQEGGKNWIQKAVKHPGRCAHMGSPECPEGSPQYNLAKRFKKGDIHKDNLKKECGSCDEMGLTSEEETCEPCAGEGQYDEREEIKLIKVMKLAAEKLEAMHRGMPGDEEPVELPPEVDGGPEGAETEEPSPFGEPDEPSEEEPSEKEPTEEPHSEPDGDESGEEPPFKKKKEKKEEDPTEFTKKLAKENHKIQKRSYTTSNDGPQNPKNVRDPEVPMSENASGGCPGCGRAMPPGEKCPKCRETQDKTSLPPKKKQRGAKDPNRVPGVHSMR
jgi:hypothetical protein